MLSLVLVLLTAYVIFGFSAEKGADSSKHSTKITNGVIKVRYPRFDKYSDSKKNRVKTNTELVVRKFAHLSEYIILGALIFVHLLSIKAYSAANRSGFSKGSGTAAIFETQNKLSKALKHQIFASFAIGALYAAADEFHQKFVPDRAPRVTDVLIDSTGVAIGIAVIFLIISVIKHNKKKNRKETSLD